MPISLPLFPRLVVIVTSDLIQLAFIVVTHDTRALDIFDRIVEMEDGRLKNATKSPQH